MKHLRDIPYNKLYVGMPIIVEDCILCSKTHGAVICALDSFMIPFDSGGRKDFYERQKFSVECSHATETPAKIESYDYLWTKCFPSVVKIYLEHSKM
jgi:hypothetical protein